MYTLPKDEKNLGIRRGEVMSLNHTKRKIITGFTLVLKIYLIVFLTGCTPRPDELPVDQARELTTRTLNGTPDEVAKAVVTVLQDMHYNLDTVDSELGLIAASKKTQRPQGRISRETPPVETEEGLTEAETFCLIAGIFAATALFLSWLFDGDIFDGDDDDDWDDDDGWGRRRVVHEHVIWGSDDHPSGASYYEYKTTVNLMDTGYGQTELRLSIQGSHYDDGILQATGPVQEAELINYFFGQVATVLGQARGQ